MNENGPPVRGVAPLPGNRELNRRQVPVGKARGWRMHQKTQEPGRGQQRTVRNAARTPRTQQPEAAPGPARPGPARSGRTRPAGPTTPRSWPRSGPASTPSPAGAAAAGAAARACKEEGGGAGQGATRGEGGPSRNHRRWLFEFPTAASLSHSLSLSLSLSLFLSLSLHIYYMVASANNLHS